MTDLKNELSYRMDSKIISLEAETKRLLEIVSRPEPRSSQRVNTRGPNVQNAISVVKQPEAFTVSGDVASMYGNPSEAHPSNILPSPVQKGKLSEVLTEDGGRALHGLDAFASAAGKESKKVKLNGSKNLSAQWDDMLGKDKEREARMQVEKIMSLEKIMPRSNLIAPDGYFKPQLRNTVLDAILTTRFDSVSTVLASSRWTDAASDPFLALQKQHFPSSSSSALNSSLRRGDFKIDRSRRHMVAIMAGNPKLTASLSDSLINIDSSADAGDDARHRMSAKLQSRGNLKADQLSIRNVEHSDVGRERDKEGTGQGLGGKDSMCFGCWSSGSQRKCSMHDSSKQLKHSETMLLCRNWDLEVIRKRYRAEEIQEIFLRKKSSLRFNTKQKKFVSIVEQKHQIYRTVSQAVERCNLTFIARIKTKKWMYSLVDELRLSGPQTLRQGSGRTATTRKWNMFCDAVNVRRNQRSRTLVWNYTQTVSASLPTAPITGHSWGEREGVEISPLERRVDEILGQEVELIIAGPTPRPLHLYGMRVYPLPVPVTIPMPKPDYRSSSETGTLTNFQAPLSILDRNGPCAWLETVANCVATECIKNACSQVLALTPVHALELLSRVQDPAPVTVKFATLGRKPAPGQLAVGGLPMELLVYQLVTTHEPCPYGSLMVMDKAAVSPGVSPEDAIKFHSLPMPPGVQAFVLRPVEHPLNHRRAPTVHISSQAGPEDRHLYGLNRSEQTGEETPHGFRTTAWSPSLQPSGENSAFTFLPGIEVASLNSPKPNDSRTTRADASYPFCVPSTRDTSSLDYYHLLLNTAFSASKGQIFTAMTTQECGDFMSQFRNDLPLGHTMVAVYRSWAFVQHDRIQEFKTDEGVPYWYHRGTGQTFWERPLHDEEKEDLLKGGTILDMEHNEAPSIMNRGLEGKEVKMLQGDFRKTMMSHHETEQDALRRRKQVARAAVTARSEQTVPGPEDYMRSQAVGNGGAERVGSHPESAVSAIHNIRALTLTGTRSTSPDTRASTPMPRDRGIGGVERDRGADIRPQPAMIQPPTQDITPHKLQFTVPNTDMMTAMTASLGQALSNLGVGGTGGLGAGSPQDMIQFGLGIGMALMQSGVLQGYGLLAPTPGPGPIPVSGPGSAMITSQPSPIPATEISLFPILSDEEYTTAVALKSSTAQTRFEDTLCLSGHNIASNSLLNGLDHTEEQQQRRDAISHAAHKLTALETAGAQTVRSLWDAGMPDTCKPQLFLTQGVPQNANEAVKAQVPVLLYPELATASLEMEGYTTHPEASKDHASTLTTGLSYALQNSDLDSVTQGNLQPISHPPPTGFYETIVSTHIARQDADYLPQVPNLPQARGVGRVKPRCAAMDWLAISFDPWSAGKSPLNTEFVQSLSAMVDTASVARRKVGVAAATAPHKPKSDTIVSAQHGIAKDAYLTIEDEEGQAAVQAAISVDQALQQEFEQLTSLCRHSKFSEVEDLLNQPDWRLPIHYQDGVGNSVLHVVVQNGNKRLAKLCLRRGASINAQNIYGQTPLHFAFGFGYNTLGEYLVSKGANESLQNRDGLTCYEGMAARDLQML